MQAIPGGLEGLVIGHVKESVHHPNSDHLHITKVDVGTGEDLQIVCGAANVAAGQKVVALAVVRPYRLPYGGAEFQNKQIENTHGETSRGMSLC